MGKFSVQVYKQNSDPMPGARVRILNTNGVDMTGSLYGILPPVYTDTSGQYLYLFGSSGPLNADVYTIEVTAPGYQPLTQQTVANFTGNGTFTFNLSRTSTAENEYTAEASDSVYVSPLAPVLVQITGPAAGSWQQIKTKVSQGDSESIILSPVDPVTGKAMVGIRNRAILPPVAHLVPDDQVAIADPDFSGTLSLEFSLIDDEGEDSIAVSVPDYHFANIYPPGQTNDLSRYTNDGHPAEWITLLKEPICFRGYYCDVMLWLPAGIVADDDDAPTLLANSDTYTLVSTDYANGQAGTPVESDLTTAVQSGKVIRIRVRTPDAGITHRVMYVKKNTTKATTDLKVHYR